METWETFTMRRKEVPRAGLLKVAVEGRISSAQGAVALQLSVSERSRTLRWPSPWKRVVASAS
ncbi:MAG TPA: hypothetical protein VNZ26_27230 [Vicinamibacterales bacterium]|jgi:hypothetical protein|nr:hypothetical protein [Vicinamibacterales bacterium]